MMTTKNSRVLLLLMAVLIASLSACSAARRALPQATVAPTNQSTPSSVPFTATPHLETTLTPAPPCATPLQTATVPPAPTHTPHPPAPTSSPAPVVERIRFASGATQGTVEGFLPANGAKVFVMGVAAGQFVEMSATVGATGRGLRFSIVGADGVVVKAMGEAYVRTVVPSTQDYYVTLVSDAGAVDYIMSVLIPARIRFAPGAISAEVRGSLAAGSVRHYVLRAFAGQQMLVVPRTTQGRLGLVISGVDGQVLLSGRVAGSDYNGTLPTTQDYLIFVRAEGESSADYTLEITIPPL